MGSLVFVGLVAEDWLAVAETAGSVVEFPRSMVSPLVEVIQQPGEVK